MTGAGAVIAHLQVKTLQAALRAKEKNLEEVNEECDDLNNQLNKVTNEKDALQMQLQKLAAHSNDEGRANRPRVTKLQQQINELQAQHPPTLFLHLLAGIAYISAERSRLSGIPKC